MRIVIPGTTLERDMRSKGLVEVNRTKAEEYKVRSRILRENKKQQEEINNLKNQIAELTQLIKGQMK